MGVTCKVPQLRFREFSGEWEVKKFKDFILAYKGGAPLKPGDFVAYSDYEVIPKKAIQSGGMLILDKDNPTFCNKDFFENNKNNVIDNSYLVTTLRDLVPSGPNIGYIVKNNSNKPLLLAQGVYGFKTKSSIDENFILQLSNRLEYRRLMQKIMVGSTQVHIRNQDFFGIYLYLPSKQEQEKIASFLSSVDSRIEQLTKKEQLLREYKKGVMQKIFSQELRFKDDDGSEFPEWVEKRFDEIFNRYDNLRIPVSSSKRILGNTPYYGANGIQGYVEGFTHDGEFILIAEDGANNLKNYPVQYVNGKIWVNNHAHILQAKEGIANNKFLKFAVSKINFEPFLVGGGRAKLNANIMMKISIHIPSLKEQTKIANFLSSLDKKIEQVSKELKLTKEFKKALLQQMFV